MFLHLFHYYILRNIFFEKLKSFLKNFFSAHFLTKKIRPQNGHFFRKKNYNLIFFMFLHLFHYYILRNIFFEKLKSFLKIFFQPIF